MTDQTGNEGTEKDSALQEAEEILGNFKESESASTSEEGATEQGASAEESGDQALREALARERADFVNYRNRAQKEKEQAAGFGKQRAILEILPAMDEIDRAREHGEIEEDSPFGKIAQKFGEALERLGAQKFGAPGDEFDPNIHEALMNREAGEEEDIPQGQTLVENLVESGYRLGGETFRTAKVTTVSK